MKDNDIINNERISNLFVNEFCPGVWQSSGWRGAEGVTSLVGHNVGYPSWFIWENHSAELFTVSRVDEGHVVIVALYILLPWVMFAVYTVPISLLWINCILSLIISFCVCLWVFCERNLCLCVCLYVCVCVCVCDSVHVSFRKSLACCLMALFPSSLSLCPFQCCSLLSKWKVL